MSTSPNKLQHVAQNLPVISQHREHKTRRAAQDQWFLENHGNQHVDPEPTVGEWLRSLAPTKRDCVQYIDESFPFSKWILNYNISWFTGDLIAGLTVGAVVIPQGMAYAKLANLPVEMGLYTSFVGGAIYFIFGSSKDINIGPIAVASIITGSVIDEVQKDIPAESRVVIAGLLALLSGIVIFLMAILRLGWLVDLIALPAIAAFVSGVAITIASGQLSPLLGIQGVNGSDPAYLILINICKKLGSAKVDAALGISSLVLLYAIKWFTAWMSGKRPRQAKIWFFVSCLRTVFVLLLYILVSFIVNHSQKDAPTFKLLGFVPRGKCQTVLGSSIIYE
jgi:sodium-independent sulfate anion transporter 11